MKGLIGKKVGMTSIFVPGGKHVACTVIEVKPNTVTQIRTLDNDGYKAVQFAVGDKKLKNSTKAEINHFAKANTAPKRNIKEFRDFPLEVELGQTHGVDFFAEGDKVEVVGTTKGKGFQGVVKRHGFSGVGSATHGQHDRSRAPGSLGGSSYPSRVFKGLRMAGRMGSDRVKIKGLKILKVLADKDLIVITGCVPGYIGSTLFIFK